MSAKIVILNDTRTEQHHGCSAVMDALLHGCRRLDAEVVHSHPVGQNWQNSTTALEAIDLADLVLVNGEGTIHDDNQRARALAAAAPYCRARGKHVVLLNASLHRLSESKQDLAAFSLMFVRDRMSANWAEAAGLVSKVTGDLTFAHTFAPPRDVCADIAFTDSVVRKISGQLKQDADLLGCDYLPIRQSLYARDYMSFVEILHRARLVVTGRYHVACFCMNMEVPFVALPSNTPKIEALLQDAFGSTKRMLLPNDIHSTRSRMLTALEKYTGRQIDAGSRRAELYSRLLPFSTYSYEEKENITEYVEKCRLSIAEMWEALAALLKKPAIAQKYGSP